MTDNRKTNILQSIHNSDFENELPRLRKIDCEQLLAQKDKFINSRKCPACNSDDSSYDCEEFGIVFKRCNNCNTLFISPCPNEELKEWFLNNSLLLEYWREKMPATTQKTRNELLYTQRADYVKNIAESLKIELASVLELGAGRGELAERICELKDVKEYICVEPQPYSYKNQKIKVIPSTIENLQLKQAVNIALAFEVIEHITEPEIFLQKIRDSLVPEGVFIFSTPNSNGFEIQLLKNNSDTVCYDHVSLYNPNSIEILLKRNGFELLKVETPGKLDVEILKRAFNRGHIQIKDNPALSFLLFENEELTGAFQSYIVDNKLSSHMRCVARKI